MEFPYKEGQVIEFTVELDDVTTLVSEYVYRGVFTAGGFDPCESDLQREKRYESGRVLRNPGSGRRLFRDYMKRRLLQRERRYKTNIPGHVGDIGLDAKKFHAATVQEVER